MSPEPWSPGRARRWVLPGDNAAFTVELMKPVVIEEKSRFAIRECNPTVGAGIVTRILE